MERARDEVGSFSGNVTKGLQEVRNVSLIASAALAGVGFAALKFGEIAGQYESIRDSFQSMTKGIVEDVDGFERRVSKASAGTLDRLTILRGGTRALSLIGKESFTDFGKDFEQMAMLSKKAARATGQDVNFMFDSLILGVSRSSKMILDNLGVNVSLEEAYGTFAKSVGKSSGELTIQEQKAALLRATLVELEKNYGNVAVTSGGFQGAMQKLNTEWTNMRIELGNAILPLLNELVRAIIPLVQEYGPILIQVIKDAALWFQELSPQIKSLVVVFISLVPIIAGVTTTILALLPVLAFLFSPVGLLVVAIQLLAAAWITNFFGIRDTTVAVFEFLKPYIMDALNFMSMAFQVWWATLKTMWTVGTAFLTNDWSQVWILIQNITKTGWAYIQSALNHGFFFIARWGTDVLVKLVQPFQDAWSRIRDLVNKIKDALDFTKRHSPSVVDIVNRGVNAVNHAMEGLDMGIDVAGTVRPSLGAVGMGGGGATVANIRIDMSGALIGDEASAVRMGERIGDSIMRKLKLNIRI